MNTVRAARERARITIGMLLVIVAIVLAAACSSDAQSAISEATDQAASSGDGGGEASDGGGGGESSDGSGGGEASDGGGGGESSDGSGGDGSADGGATDGSTSGGSTDEATTEEGLTSEDWLLIALIGVAVFAIIIFATTASSRHSEQKAAARADLNRRLNEIVGTSRWIHDSGSLEAVRHTDADNLRSSTNSVRQKMVDLEAQISATGSTGDGDIDRGLASLGSSLAGLRSAMDGLVALRTASDAADQQAQIDSATQTFNQRRQELNAAIGPVQAGMR